jgi:hypothetical protein
MSSYPAYIGCVTTCTTANHTGAAAWASYHNCVCAQCGSACTTQCQ